MTDAIRATCREFFGVYRAGRQVTPNRCSYCPLVLPCVDWQRVPGRTFEELEAGRVRFVEQAGMILEASA